MLGKKEVQQKGGGGNIPQEEADEYRPPHGVLIQGVPLIPRTEIKVQQHHEAEEAGGRKDADRPHVNGAHRSRACCAVEGDKGDARGRDTLL